MAVSFIQPTFAAGEIAPSLYARVDLAKYHAAAKLLRNFFVLPHGGASNRAGTQFVGRCLMSAYPVHLIPFQFNLLQTYILEFGHLYMRVIMNGGYVLEPTQSISSITNANPGVVTATAHGYSDGDQVYIAGTGTRLDSTPGRQYFVQVINANTFTLTDLDGNNINTAAFGTFSLSNATVARVFTLPTPYDGNDVALLKWTQSADTLSLCHPSYPPCDLSRTEHWNWTLTQISFAPILSPPAGLGFTNGGSGSWNYSYVVTGVTLTPPDESLASTAAGGTGAQLNSNTGVENNLSWTAVTGATQYRIYKANPSKTALPAGCMYGYIGTTNATSFVDTEIGPDFTQAPPQGANPFSTGTISGVAVSNGGSGYDSSAVLVVNDVTGVGAVLTPTIVGGVIQSVSVTNGGNGYQNPTILTSGAGSGAAGHATISAGILGGNPIISAVVTAPGGSYYGSVKVTCPGVTGVHFRAVISNGAITGVNCSGMPTGTVGQHALVFSQPSGSGAIFTITVTSEGNYPSCCTYFQGRKIFAGSNAYPQTVWATKPADFKNMDITNPSESDDAIVATIVASQVNAIKWMVPMNDLILMTSGGAWKMIGGSVNSPVAITPSNIVVVPQSYTGCADLPPIVVNYDILYVQAKGSIVRDLAYNFYAQLYTGTDMSILSNHLFFGHNLERWCYAEEPFKQVWAVRDDGILLSFTYLKEQDVYAWAHHDSPGNSGTDRFLSCASIPEQQVTGINADSVYFVVQRTLPGVNGGNPVKYIERMTSRNFLTNGVSDVTRAWFVDCGLQYSGLATSSVSGLDHLNGATVFILADGSVQKRQVVAGGSVTLQYPASIVTVGLPYVAQLETLCLEPDSLSMQTQSFRKKIPAVMVRVTDTRGLKVGPSFDDLDEMKERSASVSMGAAVALFTGDERIQIDNRYVLDDDVCIQQDAPLPCTILGVIPSVSIGDTPG